MDDRAPQPSTLEKLHSLSARIEATKRALEAQDKRLEALRSSVKAAAPAAKAVPVQAPKPVAVPVAAVPQAVKPRFVLPAIEEENRLMAASTRREVSFYPDTTPASIPSWTRYLPMAAVAAMALVACARVPWRSVSLRENKVAITQPAPEIAAATAMRDTPAPLETVDEQTFDTVLQLVYAYKPAGSRETIIEMLGPEIDSASSAAPWMVERGDRPGSYHATLRPYGDALDDAPVYEFDVELKSGIVRAAPTTELALRGGSVAASGR